MERIKETILNVMEGLVKKKGETKKKDPVLVLRKILTKKEFLKEEINRHGFGVKEIRFYLGEIR